MTFFSFCLIKRKSQRDYCRADRWSRLCVGVGNIVVGCKKHGDAPNTRNCNENINYPRQNACLAAGYPCHNIKAEKADGSPVKCADYGYRQRKFVNQHHNKNLFLSWNCSGGIFPRLKTSYVMKKIPSKIKLRLYAAKGLLKVGQRLFFYS